MSCFHCVWDFNSVLSDKDKILNFTLINDLSSNRAHIPLFAFLPSALMVPEPREFCFGWVFCARLLRFTPYLPRAENTADMEQRMALPSGNAQLAVEISGDGIFSDKSMWAALVQFMESFECNKKTTCKKDGGCWRATCSCILGMLGFSMMGIPSLLHHEESVKCSFSFDSCFLMNLLYVWFSPMLLLLFQAHPWLHFMHDL